MVWVTLLAFVITVVLSELLRPKPELENARPLGLGDFQFPTATEGRVVPLVFGRVLVKGPNVIWYGDLAQEAITEKVRTGLWTRERITTGFKYFLGVQFAICRGPNVVLKRVFIDDEVVKNQTITGEGRFDLGVPPGAPLGNLGGLIGSVIEDVQASCDFYPGSTTQTVNAYLNTNARQRIPTAITPTAPRYTGLCHVVARELTQAAPTANDKGAFLGNDRNIKPWSFEVERFPALFPGQTGVENTIGANGANPINVIYELLTNTEWGFGFPAADIDTGAGSSFLAASDTMITEANGFAMVLDRAFKAKDFLQEVQRQIDGVVFLDHRTGKWTIKLARADYDINLVPQLTDSNVKEVRDFTRGSWEDTTNFIQVKFDKRLDDYKESYAMAQDMANGIIGAGGDFLEPVGTVGNVHYPGVKDAALASSLAWRDLRAQSYPLARATFVVNRESWDVTVGDVVAWTNAKLGFVKLPMRVTRINYGRLEDNEIEIQAVQDVFKFADASMGNPPATNWTPPAVGLVAFPATQQLAIEAPRGIITRDPQFAGDPNISKVFCAARRQGGEVAFLIEQRNSSGTPSGTFAEAGTIVGFMRIGELNANLGTGTAVPTATVTIVPTPDGQTALESVFIDTSTPEDLGVDLVQLILVNNEFMLVQSAAINGANVDLQNVYRGVLDTVQGEHLSGDAVYLVFVGAGLTDTTFPNTNNVHINLRMRSVDDLFSGSVTQISLTMAKRALRPYPPSAPLYNGSASIWGTPDLEGDGGPGENTFGFDVDWRRRDFQTGDEVAELLADNAGVDPSTEYRVRIFVDPDGPATEVHTSAWQTGSGPENVNRLSIINEAAAGTEIRVQIEARHDILSEVDLVSRYNLFQDVVPTSVLTGLFYFGGKLRAAVVSNVYTAAATGTFTLRIGAAYSTSNVQVRINGGAFNTVIAAGLTSGTFSANTSDTIEIQHTVNETPSPNFVALDNPSAVRVAYGVFTN